MQIWDAEKACFLIKEEVRLNAEGRPEKEQDYQAILWSDLPGSEEELQSYWCIEADGYEAELKDLIPEKSLQLVIHRKNEPDYIARIYHAEIDYEKPAEFTAVAFEDLLGKDGFYIYQLYYGMFPYVHYYAMQEGRLVEIATSWGNDPAQSNFMADVNGDGDRELICNVIYMADGAHEAILYHYDGVEILQGFCGDLLDEEYDPNIIVLGKVNLVIEEKENALCVDRHAIHSSGEEFYVYTLDENNVRRMQFVELGLRGTDIVEIISGLSEGQRVIIK